MFISEISGGLQATFYMAIMAMMKRATISELKNRLSTYLGIVRAGERVMVVDRDVPVAIIERIGDRAAAEPRLARLEKAGLVRRPTGDAPIDLDLLRQPAPRSTASVLEALLEERRAGR